MTDLKTAPRLPRTAKNPPSATPEVAMPIEPVAVTSAALEPVGLGARIAGWIVALAALSLAMTLEGGHPILLLQIPVFLLVTGVVLGGLLAAHGPRRLGRLARVVCGASPIELRDAEELVRVCRRGSRLAYAAGVLQVILGTMHVLSVLDQPSLIGPGVAYALVGIVYATLFAELGFGCAEHWVRAASKR